MYNKYRMFAAFAVYSDAGLMRLPVNHDKARSYKGPELLCLLVTCILYYELPSGHMTNSPPANGGQRRRENIAFIFKLFLNIDPFGSPQTRTAELS